MSGVTSSDLAFINRLTEIILANLENEHFDVDELAHEAGMSRSYILQRLTSTTSKSTTQFIREVRLRQAMEMLQHEGKTAAEVAYCVGFSSPAYFNTCFHEFYGYPPGKVAKNSVSKPETEDDTHALEPITFEVKPLPEIAKRSIRNFPGLHLLIYSGFGLLLLLGLAFLLYSTFYKNTNTLANHSLKSKDKSISVLPFISLSKVEENQYFAEGVAENILNNLIKIRELKVVAINPVIKFSQNPLDIPGIASKLGVNFLLTGSVQRFGNRVLVIVQLIDAKHDQHIWSDKYDKQLADIFLIQSDIATQVADQLQTVLSPKEKEQIERIPTINAEAYNLYLKGRYFLSRRTYDWIKKGIEYFEKAIQTDPNYALAYAGLGDGYDFMAGQGLYTHKDEELDKAKRYLHKALELDKNLAEAHASLGRLLTFEEWNWEEAEKELTLAIRLNPNYAQAHLYYSLLLDAFGDSEKGREQIDLALELDPLSPMIHVISATLFYNEEKFEASLMECREAESLANYGWIHEIIFAIYYRQGNGKEALDELQKILLLNTLTAKYYNVVSEVYATSGLNGLTKWIIKNKKVIPGWYALFGYKEKALAGLEEFLREGPTTYGELVRLINHLDYETLRAEPRFKAVIDKLGLTEYYLKRVKQPGYLKNQ
jgi:TolB-like protein/AraC-like DNA-binding protein